MSKQMPIRMILFAIVNAPIMAMSLQASKWPWVQWSFISLDCLLLISAILILKFRRPYDQ